MSKYRSGEIFRLDGVTYQCITDYVRVTEPKEGMLFRTADGKLYELRDMTKIPIKEIYNCGCVKGTLPCSLIDDEIFGKTSGTLLHWYPIKEQKVVIRYMKG